MLGLVWPSDISFRYLRPATLRDFPSRSCMPADDLHGEGLVSSHSFGPLRSGQRRIGSNQHVDATYERLRAFVESARSFEGEHHLMNRRRAHAEVPLQVSFS